MPRYAHVSSKPSEDEFPYTVVDENNQIIARCKNVEIARIVRDEYDAIRNISPVS